MAKDPKKPNKSTTETTKKFDSKAALKTPSGTQTTTIFYSWQSDLSDSANRNGIRKGLRGVRKALKAELDLVIDEATRDTPGSPNIPNKILEKIRECDIFIADVTTITGQSYAGRPCANPNVIFELGFAAAHVGWDRVILLVNTRVSALTDLPFDFDRHRVMTYEHDDPPSTEQKKKLEASLKLGIDAIIHHKPPRPRDLEGLSSEQITRQRDIKNIIWAMEQVHQPSLDDFIETMPFQLRDKIFWYFESFRGVVNNSLFHISDQLLHQHFRKWLEGWSQALSGGAHFQPASNPSLYLWTGDRDPNGEKTRKKICKGIVKMQNARQAVLDKIRENYLEIDIGETNRAAFDTWKNEFDHSNH